MKVEKVDNSIKEKLWELKRKYPFICGWSGDIKDGKITVYVSSKIYLMKLMDKAIICKDKKYDIEYKYIGKIVAMPKKKEKLGERIKEKLRRRKWIALGKKKIREIDRTKRLRPFPMGVSFGHKDITAGTCGCVVIDDKGRRQILSNNHVVANSNKAKIGDEILQPGTYDGGSVEKDVVGHLSKFVEIKYATSSCPITRLLLYCLNFIYKIFGRFSRFYTVQEVLPENYVDAGLVLPIDDDIYSVGIADIGIPQGEDEVKVGDIVIKSGRTTGLTRAKVTDTNASLEVWYENEVAFFVNQIIFEGRGCIMGGDSGSALLKEENNKVVGLCFAGSEDGNLGIANHIKNVCEALNIKIYGEL